MVFVGEDDVGNWVFGGSEEKGFSGVGERRERGFWEVCVEEAVVVGREKGPKNSDSVILLPFLILNLEYKLYRLVNKFKIWTLVLQNWRNIGD